MQKNTIQKPEVKMPNTPEINDRDIANEVLFTEKSLANSYNTFITETSNDTLYKRIFELHKDVVQAHRNVYNLMFEKGWYKLDLEERQTLDTTYSQFENYKSQLN